MDRQLADKQSKTKRGLTLECILNYSNEDAQKEFDGVEAAFSDLIREIMPRANFMNHDDVVQDFVCSDETFLQSLKIVSGRNDEWEFLEMTFSELESEIVRVGDYRVSRNFAPILESLFNRFGNISARLPALLLFQGQRLVCLTYFVELYIACVTQWLRTSMRIYSSIGGRTLSLCNMPGSIFSLPLIICTGL